MSAPPPPPGYAPPPYQPPYQPPSRPIGVAILAILVVLVGVIFLLLAVGILILSGVFALSGFSLFGLGGAILGGIVLIFALIWIAVGMGLWRLRSWAWWLAVIVMVLTILGSITSPAVAILPVLILVYLLVVRHHFR